MKYRKAILMLCFMNIIYYGHSIAQEKIYLNRGDKIRIGLLKKTDSAPDTSFFSRWKRLNTSKYSYLIGNVEDIQNNDIFITVENNISPKLISFKNIGKFEINKFNKNAVKFHTLAGFTIGTLLGSSFMVIVSSSSAGDIPLVADGIYALKVGAVIGGIPGALMGMYAGYKKKNTWKEIPLDKIALHKKLSLNLSFRIY